MLYRRVKIHADVFSKNELVIKMAVVVAEVAVAVVVAVVAAGAVT